MCNNKEGVRAIPAWNEKEGGKSPVERALANLNAAFLRDVLSVEEALFYAQNLKNPCRRAKAPGKEGKTADYPNAVGIR